MRIRIIETDNRRDAKRFVQFPNDLYRDCPQWVPLPISDGLIQLNRKGAYFSHSDADFFVAEEGDRLLGRVCVLEHRRYNDYHHTKDAFFYLFDGIDDFEVAQALFEAIFEWASARGLKRIIGPKGFVPFDGIGLLYKGFEHRPAMGIPYNYQYYNHLIERLGFEKEIDFTSFYVAGNGFELPERVVRIAQRVKKRSRLRVKSFSSRAEVKRWVPAIMELYNRVFVNNWEYVPVLKEEAEELADRMIPIVQPEHIKLIINEQDEIVGFLFTFLDISAALQRTGGKLFPFGWIWLLLERRRTPWLNVNGMGILEKYRGRGGNAILYYELEKAIQTSRFQHADLVQMADSVENMIADVTTLGAKPYKVHRVYRRSLI